MHYESTSSCEYNDIKQASITCTVERELLVIRFSLRWKSLMLSFHLNLMKCSGFILSGYSQCLMNGEYTDLLAWEMKSWDYKFNLVAHLCSVPLCASKEIPIQSIPILMLGHQTLLVIVVSWEKLQSWIIDFVTAKTSLQDELAEPVWHLEYRVWPPRGLLPLPKLVTFSSTNVTRMTGHYSPIWSFTPPWPSLFIGWKSYQRPVVPSQDERDCLTTVRVEKIQFGLAISFFMPLFQLGPSPS